MREVLVPTTAFAVTSCRRPIALIAIWLVVLQGFLAGVATAQAGAMLASDPLASAICHGSDGGGPADSTAPERAHIQHLCCAYCTSAAPAIAPPAAPGIARQRHASRPVTSASFDVIISLKIIRAGAARAPPPPA
jgi:hypothetical protein